MTEEAALEIDSSRSCATSFLAPPTEMTATLAAEMAPEQESKQEENKKDIYSNLELVFSDGSFYLTTKEVSTENQRPDGEAPLSPPVIHATFLGSSLEQTNRLETVELSNKNDQGWEAYVPQASAQSSSVFSISDIEACIDDFAREFHDEAPRASRTRVARMAAVAEEAGMYEDDFVNLLYDVRDTTWKAQVTKRTRDGQRLNRMPYFLHLLEQELAAILAQWGLDYTTMRSDHAAC